MNGQTLQTTLWSLLTDLDAVSGAVVATGDGILIASAIDPARARQIEPDSIAAIAAATSGVGAQFANMLSLGEAGGTVVQAVGGCVGVQRVGVNAILVLCSHDGPNVARLHFNVRLAAPRVAAALRDDLPVAGH